MELYAAGFNAWNQLVFNEQAIRDEPRDLASFQVVFRGPNIDVPTSRLSYTLVLKESKIISAGIGIPPSEQELILDYNGAENALGEILAAELDATAPSGALLVKFPDLSSRKAGKSSHSWPCKKGIRHIAAYDAGWVVLYDDGTVATLGDPRFGDCLGREVTEGSPAEEPGEVLDLNNLGDPIRKVAAGGYTVAALTESGSLYAWGVESPGTHRRQQAIPGLSGIPNYVEVDDDEDVQDMAVGESHAIALTAHGSIHVIGGNENGQLGYSEDKVMDQSELRS
ncbi:hypothetical protein ACO1O0_007207 [Amphichorda felina]